MEKVVIGKLVLIGLVSTIGSSCSGIPAKLDRSQASSLGQIYRFESGAEGFNTQNFFYDNGEEVVVFDTQFTPELARQSLDFIRTRTANPITHVIITHPNPDKFNGIQVFKKTGAKVIASKKTADSMPGVHGYKKAFFINVAKSFSEETYPQLTQVDQTFEQELDIRLKNGELIQLRELSQPGVSSNQTIAWIPSANAAFVGDLVHHHTHAWLEGGIVNGNAVPTLRDWIVSLEELQAFLRETPQAMIYGGRGKANPAQTVIPAQIAYLERAEELVVHYIAELGPHKSELSGPKAGGHYQALQALFEKEFPGYELGYMIQYGVYGLVNSKL